MPINKGFKAREGEQFSLPSPSLFYFVHSRQSSRWVKWVPKWEGNGRENALPSRVSISLGIGVCGVFGEYVRVICENFYKNSKAGLAISVCAIGCADVNKLLTVEMNDLSLLFVSLQHIN